MSFIGGSILEASVRGRNFGVAADADLNVKQGGFENEVRPNGDSTARIIQMVVAWNVDNVVLACDLNRGDFEFLQEVADSGEQVDMTFTLPGNIVVQSVGTITGEIVYSTQNATATVSMSGGGKLTRQ